MSIFEKISHHKSQNLPFVIYRKPKEKKLTAFLQKDNMLHETSTFSEKGFVFCSFDGLQNVLFQENNCDIITEDFVIADNEYVPNVNIQNNISVKERYLNLVAKTISEINASSCTKIVISRKETIEAEVNTINLFKKLLFFNPTAFVYMFFHPEVGHWLGAFGEQLLKIQKNMLSTMSLAGTQEIVENKTIVWKEKERAEQQIVTDFIASTLANSIESIQIAKPITIFSGNVAHLKSDISGQLNPNYNLKNIINSLHPTPAICGFPKEEAKNFILKNENYNREFYGGFLGELNLGKDQLQTSLFVNLRCLKVNAKTVDIFVGGGITKDSIPESEWEETVNKSVATKRLL